MPAVKLKKNRIVKPQSKNVTHKASRKKAEGQKVALERLAWKKVELPDRLEDPEGFYGLEEIDDVDIMKDNDGKVEYIVHSADRVRAGSTSEEAEWEGFASSSGEEDSPQVKTKSNQPIAKEGSPELVENAFAVLEDEAMDEGVDVSAWSPLKLRPEILASLSKLGFQTPTPIQKAAIPDICAGRDVIGKAPTGSGKTLAYGIPILEHILNSTDGTDAPPKKAFAPTAFIISPTRELAKQLEEHLKALCSSVTSHARIATVTGGLAVQKQQRQLATADIVIGTPGRLWDVFSATAGLFDGLRKIKFLVIDEADRLLSSGQFKEVEDILHSLDRSKEAKTSRKQSQVEPRQTLVFSATFQKDLHQKLAGKGRANVDPNSLAYLLRKLRFYDPDGKPKFVDINPFSTSQLAPLLKEAMLECATTDKDLYLYATLILQPAGTKTLVFANSIAVVRRITVYLQSLQLPAHALHSQMPQKSRLRALERFAAGKTPASVSGSETNTTFDPSVASTTTGPILVATDVAARGLDIPAVHLVLHYHAPRSADMYIHRSGRTARGSSAGTALLLCSPDEVVPVRRLAAKVHAQDVSAGERAGLRAARLDLTLVSRLRQRANLASRIATLETEASKARSRDNLLREAAADLGADLDGSDASNDSTEERGSRPKKGKDKKKQQQSDTPESAQLRAQLKALLRRRVNVGVSETYLTAGGMDVAGMLRGEAGAFVGQVGGLEID